MLDLMTRMKTVFILYQGYDGNLCLQYIFHSGHLFFRNFSLLCNMKKTAAKRGK